MNKNSENSQVTCTQVDPDVLRSGKGLKTAMRNADSTVVEQGVFDRRTERRHRADQARMQSRRDAKKAAKK